MRLGRGNGVSKGPEMGMHGHEKTECEKGGRTRHLRQGDPSTFLPIRSCSRPQSYGGLRRTLSRAVLPAPPRRSGQRWFSLAWAAGGVPALNTTPSPYLLAMCPAPPSGHLGRREAEREGQAWVPPDTQPFGPVLWDRDGTEADSQPLKAP